MLTIAKMDRYDLVNTPGDDKPSFTIWFSGCSMKCDGCQNSRLWDITSGQEYGVNDVVYFVCRETELQDINTIVLLGGEPLEQNYESLLKMVTKLDMMGYKIWLYTGFEFEQIPESIKSHLYTIKCGRYDKTLAKEGFPSSSNQKVYRKTDNKWTEITF